jgi:hypothetical protein
MSLVSFAVARKRDDSERAKRNDESARLDSEALKWARMAAAAKGQTLAEYLSEVVLDRALADLNELKAAIPPPKHLAPKRQK